MQEYNTAETRSFTSTLVRKCSQQFSLEAPRQNFTMQWHEVVTIFLSSVVESVCSMFFVLIGCGSTITWPQHETSPNVLSVSMCFGFSCAFLVNISTLFSGGFFNPAITAALAANKSLSAKRALCYVLAQLIGGKNFVFFSLTLFYF